jgi:hypothetical protein
MSTDFRPRRWITAADLFGGRLEKHGVREIIVEPKNFEEWVAEQGLKVPPGASGCSRLAGDALKARLEKIFPPETFAHMAQMIDESAGKAIPGTTKHMRCLTDGTNYMWVQIWDGFVNSINCTIANNPTTILGGITQEFDTDIIREDDAEFWEDHKGEVAAIDVSKFEAL